MNLRPRSLILLTLVGSLCACTEAVGGGGSGEGGSTGTDESGAPDADEEIDLSDQGTPLSIEVSPDTPVYVDLHEVAVVEPSSPQSDDSWELSFVGYDVFTNSGVSGSGEGGAFGPLAAPTFLLDVEPEYPFLIDDQTGGAFLGWYAYDGSTHALWSRYHVYGVDTGERRFKVQVLGYYGEVQGAPVTALYSLRYAEIGPEGVGPTQIVDDLDGSAGGLNGPPDAPSGCLNLVSGEQLMLSPSQAQSASDWHLCVRRDVISVNGGLGGPGGVTAVDVTAASLEKMATLEEVTGRTAASMEPAFDAVDQAALDAPELVYRGDRVVSAFDTRWYDASVSPPAPALATWVVAGADGTARFLLAFESFEGASDQTPARVNLRVKRVD